MPIIWPSQTYNKNSVREGPNYLRARVGKLIQCCGSNVYRFLKFLILFDITIFYIIVGFWAVLVENRMSHHSLVALLYAFINSCNKVKMLVVQFNFQNLKMYFTYNDYN